MKQKQSKIKQSSLSKQKASSKIYSSSKISSSSLSYSRQSKQLQMLSSNFQQMESKVTTFILKMREKKIQLLQKYNMLCQQRNTLQYELKSQELKEMKELKTEKETQQRKCMKLMERSQELKSKLEEQEIQYRRIKVSKLQLQKVSPYQIQYQSEVDEDPALKEAMKIYHFQIRNSKEKDIIQHLMLEKQKLQIKVLQNTQEDVEMARQLERIRQEVKERNEEKTREERLAEELQYEEICNKENQMKDMEEETISHKQLIEELYHEIQFPDETNQELEAYIDEEEREKEKLFEELTLFKSEFKRMKQQNDVLFSLLK